MEEQRARQDAEARRTATESGADSSADKDTGKSVS